MPGSSFSISMRVAQASRSGIAARLERLLDEPPDYQSNDYQRASPAASRTAFLAFANSVLAGSLGHGLVCLLLRDGGRATGHPTRSAGSRYRIGHFSHR